MVPGSFTGIAGTAMCHQHRSNAKLVMMDVSNDGKTQYIKYNSYHKLKGCEYKTCSPVFLLKARFFTSDTYEKFKGKY